MNHLPNSISDFSCLWLILSRALQGVWGGICLLNRAQQHALMSAGCCCPCPVNNQKWKCEETEQPSSIADKKGRNLGRCKAFMNAKLWGDAESKPSQQWSSVAPNSTGERCVNYTTKSHTRTNPPCLQCVIWCFMEELIPPLGDQG